MSEFGMNMGVGMWLFWIVFIVLVVIIVRIITDKSSGQSDSRPEDPLDILKQRYARGEISKDEFESMKQALEK